MPLFTCGSVHQGDERFSNDSCGKQCSFISLIALFVEQTIPVCEWNCQTVDNILSLGDCMYLHALKNQLIPSTELLSVTNLPSVLGCGKGSRCILTALSTSNTTIFRRSIQTVITPYDSQLHTKKAHMILFI
jgi:hypothetical protein